MTTRRYNPEDSHLQTGDYPENQKKLINSVSEECSGIFVHNLFHITHRISRLETP
jgi:hypothetical protein